jgi:hypothetical protein
MLELAGETKKFSTIVSEAIEHAWFLPITTDENKIPDDNSYLNEVISFKY